MEDINRTRRLALSSDLSEKLLYWEIKRQVKNEIIKPQYSNKDLKTLIPKVMEDMGLTTKLRNTVYELYHKRMRQQALDDSENGGNTTNNNNNNVAYNNNNNNNNDSPPPCLPRWACSSRAPGGLQTFF